MHVVLGKLLSLLVAIGYLLGLGIAAGKIDSGLFCVGGYLLGPLALIWFPEFFGSFTGYIGRGGTIDWARRHLSDPLTNQRAAELANDADVRLWRPKPKSATQTPASKTKTGQLALNGDDRLPPAGTIITREYKGPSLQVKVLPMGFEFEGEARDYLTELFGRSMLVRFSFLLSFILLDGLARAELAKGRVASRKRLHRQQIRSGR